jgi:hypothetical protein
VNVIQSQVAGSAAKHAGAAVALHYQLAKFARHRLAREHNPEQTTSSHAALHGDHQPAALDRLPEACLD